MTSKIIVQIRGGLGNQLYTYATAYALARRNGSDIVIDTKLYDSFYQLRRCVLDQFCIDVSKKFFHLRVGSGKIQVRIYDFLHDMKLRFTKAVVVEEKEEFVPQEFPLPGKAPLYLAGYWQCHEYFDEYRDELVRMFTLRDRSFWDEDAALRSFFASRPVAMHVRRTDYQTMKGGWCLTPQYYRDALDLVRKKAGERPVLVFSDDPEYCRKEFGDLGGLVFPDSLPGDRKKPFSDVEEFFLMTRCSHFIIANSSFSWWAAYLAENEGKQVIAPVTGQWKKSFYLPEWTTIDTSTQTT